MRLPWDITEQVETKKQLERAIHEAEKANEAKTTFLANISHELRTPMTAVLGFADILRIELNDPDHVEKVDTITRNGKYLLTLLDDLLDLSKIEVGKAEVARESVAVRSLIKDVSTLMSVRATQEGIPLYFEWLTEVPKRITADRIRTRQILVNLISNALKFTNEGEVRVRVSLNRENPTPTLDIAVSDTGIGIPLDQQQEIFQPFTQASYDTGREFGGAGLGLSISKRLAKAMGGTIAVQSELGKGSCFTLSLQVTEKQIRDLVQPVKQPAIKKTSSAKNKKLPHFDARILLADDRRDVWRVGKYFLERCGAEVSIAEDGRQALDATLAAIEAGNPFRLILMDMQMPVMNGEEAVRELRAKGVDVPIIALTADAMERQRDECLQAGCTDYFAKPIDGMKLMHLVASLLQPPK